MYSAISGLKNFQTKLDVVGNNIANVSTTGFKKGRVTFQDLMSQQVTGASSPTANRGGVNPSQVGLGAKIGTIDTITEQGNMQNTGRPLDLAISGDGYFIVNNGNSSFYTRAGNFYLDDAGNLVNSDGYYVQAYSGTDTTGTPGKIAIDKDKYSSFSIGPTGEITGVNSDNQVETIGTIALAQFNNPDGLTKAGNNLFTPSGNSGPAEVGTADSAGSSIQSSTLEMSNVDLSEEFTSMIEAQRGFQANARVITTSDQILQELVDLKR